MSLVESRKPFWGPSFATPNTVSSSCPLTVVPHHELCRPGLSSAYALDCLDHSAPYMFAGTTYGPAPGGSGRHDLLEELRSVSSAVLRFDVSQTSVTILGKRSRRWTSRNKIFSRYPSRKKDLFLNKRNLC